MSNKPISARKLAANRANAKKSTGPRTPQGKARSRLNALKHGLFASQLAAQNDPQAAAELAAIRRNLMAELHHPGMLERLLVETIAACISRLNKAYRIETLAMNNAASDATPAGDDESRESRPLTPTSDFGLLLRHQARVERILNRSLEYLLTRHGRQPIPGHPRDHVFPNQPTGRSHHPPSRPHAETSPPARLPEFSGVQL